MKKMKITVSLRENLLGGIMPFMGPIQLFTLDAINSVGRMGVIPQE